MKRTFLLFILSACLFSCENKKIDTTIKADSRTFAISSEDVEMNQAMENAKNTFGNFEKAFISNKYDDNTFSIKVRFPTPSGAEHIWTTNLTRKDGCFWGSIDEAPNNSTINVKVGDKFKITMENLSDWLYLDHNVMIGGYTIKVARHHMQPDELKKFDSIYRIVIND